LETKIPELNIYQKRKRKTCNEGKAASEKRAGELQALKPKTLFGHLTRYYEFKIIVINGRTVFFDHILIAVESSRLSRNKIGDDPAFDKTQRLELDDEHAMVKKTGKNHRPNHRPNHRQV
jgi:hypothetical protein